MLLNNVVEAIIERWPTEEFYNDDFTIQIQQDWASTHRSDDDDLWLEFLEAMGLEKKIKLYYKQPANSPDTNINDLGFFASLHVVVSIFLGRVHLLGKKDQIVYDGIGFGHISAHIIETENHFLLDKASTLRSDTNVIDG